MTEFKKYSSLENSYREKFVNSIRRQVDPDAKWSVFEKVHGANFSFWVFNDNKLTMKCAKRSGFIGEGESFFAHERVVERHRKGIEQLAKGHIDGYEGPDIAAVAVFGELCGGSGNDLPKVQKGVFYSNDIHFLVFDIMIMWKNGEHTYKGVQDIVMECSMNGLMSAPLMERGSLEECLNMSPEFQSLVPGLLGEEAPKDNMAEGLVIRPMRETILHTGSRAILKQKSEKFSEKKQGPKTPKVEIQLSDKANQVYDDLSSYVLNENRISAVISKIGEVSHRDTGKLMGLVMSDALEDFIKDNEFDPSKELDKAEWKKIAKSINPQLAQLIMKVV